jgi:hypothetical protein
MTACSSGTKSTTLAASNTTTSTVSFSKDIQPIFNNNCVVCHQGQVSGQAGLSLEPKLSYSNLVGIASTENPTELRVKIGAPEQSYIIAKLTGTQVEAGGNGGRMPYGAGPLPQGQIDLINQWIRQGALNN